MTALPDDRDLLEPAFVIEHVNDEFDLDIPPTSGMEYLRRVQMEAKQCPHVVVADIDTSPYYAKQTVKVSQTSGLHPAPRGLAPSVAWQKAQVSNFSKLRQNMARHKAKTKKANLKLSAKLPKKENVEGWCKLCFGTVQHPRLAQECKERGGNDAEDTSSSASSASDPESYTVTPPLVSILAAMDQATVVQVFEYHLNWFEATGFSEEQGRWFYALLTVLEKTLSPEACSLLRSFAGNCANLRATLEKPDDVLLTPLNLFIALVSRYFDQIDMADER